MFSAFAYPYLLFQVIGGWVGDRFGPHKTLFWCGMIWAAATIMTGFVTSLLTLFIARVALGFGEGATFPTATRAMQYWTPANKRGFAQGPHARIRAAGKCHDAANDSGVDGLADLARFIHRAGTGQPGLGRGLGRVFPQRAQGSSGNHRGRAGIASAAPRQYKASGAVGTAVRRMWPVTLTYFCYGWTLWLYLNWLPLFFKNNFHLDIKNSALFASGVFFAGVLGDGLGGILSDRVLRRRATSASRG